MNNYTHTEPSKSYCGRFNTWCVMATGWGECSQTACSYGYDRPTNTPTNTPTVVQVNKKVETEMPLSFENDTEIKSCSKDSDLISRAEAIEAARLGSAIHGLLGQGDILDILYSLPSANTVEVVRCKDCKWYESGGLPCPLDLCESLGDDGFCSYGERSEE